LRENSGCSKQREDNQYVFHQEPPGTGPLPILDSSDNLGFSPSQGRF
jgi:hypothetical protein